MDHAKHSHTFRNRSTKQYRRLTDKKENFPNGYVEDCSIKSNPSELSVQFGYDNSILEFNVSDHNNSKSSIRGIKPDASLSSSRINSSTIENQKKIPLQFTPVSIILSTQTNILLTKETFYDIHFSTGMLEGSGLCINETGNQISFQEEGSYRFEICGEATPYSDIDVKLIFYSEGFTDDIRFFSEIHIPKDEGKLQLRGLATILPIQKNQTITPRLIPTPDESIILMANTRLLIHRVA